MKGQIIAIGLLGAGLMIGTAPSAGAKCGVDWINQQPATTSSMSTWSGRTSTCISLTSFRI